MVCGDTGDPSSKYKWLSLCPTQWASHVSVLGSQFIPQYSLRNLGLECKFEPRDLDAECRGQLSQGLLPICYLLRNHQVDLRQNKDQTLLIPELRSVCQKKIEGYGIPEGSHTITDPTSQHLADSMVPSLVPKLLSGPGLQLGTSAVLRISGIQCLQQNVRLPQPSQQENLLLDEEGWAKTFSLTP